MSADAIAITPEALIANGFVAMTYPGQDGVYYRRDTTVRSMPYLGRVIDREYIFEDSVVRTEVHPDGRVQVSIAETDYVEELVPASSEDGQGCLRDAIAGIATEEHLARAARA